MSQHLNLQIEATVTGDAITALNETIEIAKALKRNIELKVFEYWIMVRPTSEIMDLVEIYKLKEEIRKQATEQA